MTGRESRDDGHDALYESSGLYVLGALVGEERARFERHMAECEVCLAEVRTLGGVADVLPFSVPQVPAPPELRARVLAAARTARPPLLVRDHTAVRAPASPAVRPHSRGTVWAGWFAAAASLAMAAGLGGYAATLQVRLRDVQQRLGQAMSRLQESEQRLDAANRDATVVRMNLALVTSADVVDLRLAGQPPARQASGRAFVSRSRGVLLAASNLPALPANRVYQVWFLTPGAPVSGGLLRPDDQGNATVTFPVAADTPAFAGLAVSLEPEGGVPAPTGAIYLATQ